MLSLVGYPFADSMCQDLDVAQIKSISHDALHRLIDLESVLSYQE
jgi:hypothetical protein